MTVRDALLIAMEDLDDRSFRKFCDKIRDWDIEEGYGKIRRGIISKAGPDDVVDLIRSHYTESYGPELTFDVLNAIDEKKVALELQENLEKVKGFNWRKRPNEEPEPPAKEAQAQSFVDKHREALIARVPDVPPILDGLISKKLITTEENDTILAEKTSQERMRKLYRCMRQWSFSHKETLYDILKEKNHCLIEDLEEP